MQRRRVIASSPSVIGPVDLSEGEWTPLGKNQKWDPSWGDMVEHKVSLGAPYGDPGFARFMKIFRVSMRDDIGNIYRYPGATLETTVGDIAIEFREHYPLEVPAGSFVQIAFNGVALDESITLGAANYRLESTNFSVVVSTARLAPPPASVSKPEPWPLKPTDFFSVVDSRLNDLVLGRIFFSRLWRPRLMFPELLRACFWRVECADKTS